MKDHLRTHCLLVPLAIGVGTLGVGVWLGATKQAMIAVGSSNLPMVLALAGSSLALASAVIYHVNSKDTIGGLFATGIAILVISFGYVAVHFGIAQVLPSSLSVAESLGAQADIGFGMGFISTLLVLSVLHFDKFQKTWPNSLFYSFLAGICCAASAAAGPALVAAMGSAAANSTEAISLEAIISVAIASAPLILIMGADWTKKEIEVSCIKQKQV